MRRIDYIVIHCTATPEGKDFRTKDIDAWHKKKGWKGIGYHYVVCLDGEIEPGRQEGEVGSHVKGYNQNSLGIVYVGGTDEHGTPKDTRTPAQKEALRVLLESLKARFPNAITQGHRDFPNVRKACPCFDAIAEYAGLKAI